MQDLTENLALKAANLYSEGLSFGKISEKLEVSKSRVGDLLREALRANNAETHDEASGVQLEGEQENDPENIEYQRPFLQNTRPESYTLETAGIPKRIILTPKALMIYEIWTSCGFEGDLSDFLEDAVNYLYETRKPADRMNYG